MPRYQYVHIACHVWVGAVLACAAFLAGLVVLSLGHTALPLPIALAVTPVLTPLSVVGIRVEGALLPVLLAGANALAVGWFWSRAFARALESVYDGELPFESTLLWVREAASDPVNWCSIVGSAVAIAQLQLYSGMRYS